ncbi:MAG: hypothetical protein M3Q48_03300 [Actinomycetota bacterium]|nr:hypothetical protein [Actinomycetota bacterium]
MVELERADRRHLAVAEGGPHVALDDPAITVGGVGLDRHRLQVEPAVEELAHGHRRRGDVAALVDLDDQAGQLPLGLSP